jgi:hypothetical protein
MENKMHNTKKALAVMLVELLIAGGMGAFILGSFNAKPAQALAFIPYGGWEGIVVPAVLAPPPAVCPMHTVIISATPGIPVFGVYVPPFGQLLLYDYKNLFVPGTPILGGYDPIPFVTCKTPYFVYPIDFNAPFYLTGTGAL